MELMVLNKNYESICLIDEFKSLIWTDRYYSTGDFELEIAAGSRFLQYLQEGYYAWIKESKHLMIIETIKITTDSDEGDYAIVSGRSLESILDRRIVWNSTDISEDSSVQDGVKQLLNENIISPEDENRKISNFIFVESDNEYIKDLKFGAQYNGDNLYDVICDICQAFNIGFKIEFYDKYDLDGETLYNQFVFQLYYGEDRTYDQTKNPYVIFSPKFSNIINSNYLESDEKLRNVTLVGGEDNRNTTVTLNKNDYMIDNTPSVYEGGMSVEFKNVTAPDTLTTDIYAQKGSFEIDKRLYSGYQVMRTFNLTNKKARVSFEKLDKKTIKINNTNYEMESFSSSTTSLSIQLFGISYSHISTLFTNCIAAAKNGYFIINNKRYGPYYRFDDLSADCELQTVYIRFSKPSEAEDKNYNTIKLNSKTYYIDESVSVSDSSLSFTTYPYKSNITNPNTMYKDVEANNGAFELLGKTYINYSNLTGMQINNQDGMKVSFNLSKEKDNDTKYTVKINGTNYTVTSYSVSTTSLSLSFYKVSDINALVTNCAAHQSSITVDGKTYSGYTIVRNYNVSWSDEDGTRVCSVSVQFEQEEAKKYVKLNNVNYVLDSYSQDENVLSITVKEISNVVTLLNNANAAVKGNIVVDTTTYKDYKIFSSYEMVPTEVQSNGSATLKTVNLQYAKYDEKYPMVINGNTYYVNPDGCSVSDNVLSVQLDMDISKIEPLIADLKAHEGDITFNEQTYSGYTELGDITIDNDVRVYEGFITQVPTVSFQMNKPDAEDANYKQRMLTVYNTTEEESGIERRELYTDARDISSETDDDVTLTEEEYNEKLKQRGLEQLADNQRSIYFDGQVEASVLFTYENDFFMGDIVQIENEFGIAGIARITEFIRSQDASGFEMYPTFEAIQEDEIAQEETTETEE